MSKGSKPNNNYNANNQTHNILKLQYSDKKIASLYD